MDYFYAKQLRQYRLQIIRAFSNFYVNFGTEDLPNLRRVPCRYGDPSRIAQSIIQSNSENKMLSTPFISCIITGINLSADRRQDPMLVDKIQINERKYNNEINRYTQDVENRYTVERYMPVPYELKVKVDIWTSNIDQKEQLIEQIFMLYNPSIEFQTSNNPIDWTWLSYIEMEEGITWSSRNIPIGTENPIDVLSLSFKVPIWINPPSKVKKQSIIQQIVTSIIQGSKDQSENIEWNEYEFLSRIITTPENYSIELEYIGNFTYEIKLLSDAKSVNDSNHLPTVTKSKINPTLVPGTTFSFNNISITINTNILSNFINEVSATLKGTPYSIQLHNKNTLYFINETGGNNVFSNITGSPIENFGLIPTVYQGGTYAWWRLFELYGKLTEYNDYGSNASQLRIKTSTDIESFSEDVVGWISTHPTDQNKIIWTIDQQSLPTMTLTAINAIIDPQNKGPNIGLPPASVGQRYLLVNKPSEFSVAWGYLSANENDIIEFKSDGWKVVFDSETNDFTQYVINSYTGKIYKWNDGEWSIYLNQLYTPGYWRLSL